MESYFTTVDRCDVLRGGIPIVTWHKMGRRPLFGKFKSLYLHPSYFARQLEGLAAAGWRTISLSDLKTLTVLPEKRLIMTFDDGFESVGRHALEPMRQCGFHAIQFIVAHRIGGRDEWDSGVRSKRERLMDAAAIRNWLAAGHEIGSHSLTHPRLTKISIAAAREEIVTSKKTLEDMFGIPVRHFCYPYGDWNIPVRDMVDEAGYETAVTTEFGVNTLPLEMLSLRRITARQPSRKLKNLFGWVGKK